MDTFAFNQSRSAGDKAMTIIEQRRYGVCVYIYTYIYIYTLTYEDISLTDQPMRRARAWIVLRLANREVRATRP